MEAKQMSNETNTTTKLFYEDSYMKEFTATVLSCEEGKKGYQIVLDQTAFFPEGGGQFGDVGTLNGIEVIDTREKAGVIYHITREPIEPGTTVNGILDFEVRFSRMQQHTGEHILTGVIHGLYGYDNVGFHLGDEFTTLDFNGELTPEQVQDAEERANRAVFANIPVNVLYPSKEELKTLEYRSKIEIEGQVRIVAIPGVDICACCAPHTATTGSVGLIKIYSYEKHRGGCRITIVCGMRALKDFNNKQQNVTDISVALSAKPDKVAEAVLRLKDQQVKMREQLNALQEAHLKQRLDKISAEDQYVCIFEEEMDTVAVRNFVNDAMEKCSGICAAFVGTDETGYRYILGSKALNMRDFSKKLNDTFSGKGGGKPEMVQGSLASGSQEEILKMVEETSCL